MPKDLKPGIFTYERQADPEARIGVTIDQWVRRRLAWMMPRYLMTRLLWTLFRHFFALAVVEPENPFVQIVLDNVHGHARFWLYRAIFLHRLETEGDPAPLITLHRMTGTSDPEKQARWCLEQIRQEMLEDSGPADH